MTALALGVAAWLLVVGIYGVVTSRNLVHLVVCVAVAQSSTYVLLLAVGYRTGGIPPVDTTPDTPHGPFVDPVVQAMTLTDIVVAAAVTALLLAMVVQAHKRTGTLDPDALRSMRG